MAERRMRILEHKIWSILSTVLGDKIFNDPLQKRLREMEKENPSPSLKNVKPTSEDKIYFSKRYFKEVLLYDLLRYDYVIEQIPQDNDCYSYYPFKDAMEEVDYILKQCGF